MYSQAFPAVTALWSPTNKNNIIQIIKFKNQFFLSTLPDYERATNILGTGTLRLAHLTLVERAHTRHHTSAPCAMFSVDLATASTDIGQTVCVCVCALYADTHFEFTFLFRWFCAYHIYHRPTNQEFGENKSVYASINFPIWVLALDSNARPLNFHFVPIYLYPNAGMLPIQSGRHFAAARDRVASHLITLDGGGWRWRKIRIYAKCINIEYLWHWTIFILTSVSIHTYIWCERIQIAVGGLSTTQDRKVARAFW